MKPDLFVFDTNILISALFDNGSTPALALKKARMNGILIVSEEMTLEYFQVFTRSKFDKYLPLPYRLAFLENIISNALPVIPEVNIVACRDAKDDKFLSAAVAGGATYIVSGDNDLLVMNPFMGVTIVKPTDFLNSILTE